MESGGKESRRAMRIIRHFVVRFRQTKPPALSNDWDVSTVRNISKTGILFHSSRPYEVGFELEIMITSPLSHQEVRCWARVVRCNPLERIKNLYGVAVDINRIEEECRETFDKTIEYFIKKDEEEKEGS